MEKALRNLHDNLMAYNRVTNDGLADKLKKFEDGVESVMGTIAGNNEDINDNIEDLQKAIRELNATLKSRR